MIIISMGTFGNLFKMVFHSYPIESHYYEGIDYWGY
jgi:hypothetical protein